MEIKISKERIALISKLGQRNREDRLPPKDLTLDLKTKEGSNQPWSRFLVPSISGETKIGLLEIMGVRKNIVERKKLLLGSEELKIPRLIPANVTKLIKEPKNDGT